MCLQSGHKQEYLLAVLCLYLCEMMGNLSVKNLTAPKLQG